VIDQPMPIRIEQTTIMTCEHYDYHASKQEKKKKSILLFDVKEEE
jgi:hypothetical protein